MRVTNLLSSAVKCLQLQLRPPDPLTRGSGPGPRWGHRPPDPHIGSRSRARHILSVPVLFLTGNEPSASATSRSLADERCWVFTIVPVGRQTSADIKRRLNKVSPRERRDDMTPADGSSGIRLTLRSLQYKFSTVRNTVSSSV